MIFNNIKVNNYALSTINIAKEGHIPITWSVVTNFSTGWGELVISGVREFNSSKLTLIGRNYGKSDELVNVGVTVRVVYIKS